MSSKARKRYARQTKKPSGAEWSRLTIVMAPGYRDFIEMVARHFDMNVSELNRHALKLFIKRMEDEGRLPTYIQSRLKEIRKEYGSDDLF